MLLQLKQSLWYEYCSQSFPCIQTSSLKRVFDNTARTAAVSNKELFVPSEVGKQNSLSLNQIAPNFCASPRLNPSLLVQEPYKPLIHGIQ